MRCDRISLMHAGQGAGLRRPAEAHRRRAAPPTWRTPSSVTWTTRSPTPRRQRRARTEPPPRPRPPPRQPPRRAAPTKRSALRLRLGRMLAYSRNETHADPARPGPPAVRLRRLGAADARLRLRHHHRRRAHPLRLPRPRSVAREPRLPRAVRGLAALLHANAAGPLRRREALERLQVGRRLAGRSRFRPTSAGTSAEAIRARGRWRRSTAPRRSAARPSRSTSQGVHNTCLQRSGDAACQRRAASKYTRRHRGPLHVQPDVRERLLDRAERAGASC